VQLLAYDSQLQRTHAPSDYRAPLQQAPNATMQHAPLQHAIMQQCDDAAVQQCSSATMQPTA
jgi:hypothetical protein